MSDHITHRPPPSPVLMHEQWGNRASALLQCLLAARTEARFAETLIERLNFTPRDMPAEMVSRLAAESIPLVKRQMFVCYYDADAATLIRAINKMFEAGELVEDTAEVSP